MNLETMSTEELDAAFASAQDKIVEMQGVQALIDRERRTRHAKTQQNALAKMRKELEDLEKSLEV